MRRNLAAGNWKMNGLRGAADEIVKLAALQPNPNCDVLICPPATLLAPLAKVSVGTSVAVGGQDCHQNEKGAHTGDISAVMLKDAGAAYVIVGHSERRDDHGESNDLIAAKAQAAWTADLKAIVCCGESEAQRDSGATLDHIGAQLAASIPDGATAETLVVAYEPIWAIGTGRTPTLEDIKEVHDFIRNLLVTRFGDATGNGVRILYGGSMNPGNVVDISAIKNVDGGLVGGASLKAEDFTKIVTALNG